MTSSMVNEKSRHRILENAKPPPPLSDENEFAFAQNERDMRELEKTYGNRWPELHRSVVAFCNQQPKEWQDQKFREIEQQGQVTVFKKLIEQLRLR